VGCGRAVLAPRALAPNARAEDWTDAFGLDFGAWRLNLRASKTEPLLRLIVEARGNAGLVEAGVSLVRDPVRG
jgi:phosphomannomutase